MGAIPGGERVGLLPEILAVAVPPVSTMPESVGVSEACAWVEGRLASLVWDTAVVEQVPFSKSEVEAILSGEAGVDRSSWEAKKILATADSYRLLVDKVRSGSYVLDASTVADFNRVLSVQDNLAPGVFRGETQNIGGGGTVSVPGFGHYIAPQDVNLRQCVDEALEASARFENPWERAVYLFATIALLQPFYEGNKRTGLLMAGGFLMSQGFRPLVTTGERVGEYQAGLTALFSRLDTDPLTEFFCG